MPTVDLDDLRVKAPKRTVCTWIDCTHGPRHERYLVSGVAWAKLCNTHEYAYQEAERAMADQQASCKAWEHVHPPIALEPINEYIRQGDYEMANVHPCQRPFARLMAVWIQAQGGIVPWWQQ